MKSENKIIELVRCSKRCLAEFIELFSRLTSSDARLVGFRTKNFLSRFSQSVDM